MLFVCTAVVYAVHTIHAVHQNILDLIQITFTQVVSIALGFQAATDCDQKSPDRGKKIKWKEPRVAFAIPVLSQFCLGRQGEDKQLVGTQLVRINPLPQTTHIPRVPEGYKTAAPNCCVFIFVSVFFKRAWKANQTLSESIYISMNSCWNGKLVWSSLKWHSLLIFASSRPMSGRILVLCNSWYSFIVSFPLIFLNAIGRLYEIVIHQLNSYKAWLLCIGTNT